MRTIVACLFTVVILVDVKIAFQGSFHLFLFDSPIFISTVWLPEYKVVFLYLVDKHDCVS